MVVQDLANETDVFMEFGHLSSKTRQKIEEFRRRRQAAEEYNETSPIKPPKSARRSSVNAELSAQDKSLRHLEVNNLFNKFENTIKILQKSSYFSQIVKNLFNIFIKIFCF